MNQECLWGQGRRHLQLPLQCSVPSEARGVIVGLVRIQGKDVGPHQLWELGGGGACAEHFLAVGPHHAAIPCPGPDQRAFMV